MNTIRSDVHNLEEKQILDNTDCVNAFFLPFYSALFIGNLAIYFPSVCARKRWANMLTNPTDLDSRLHTKYR